MTVCHNQGRLHGAPASHRDTAGASSHLPRLSLAGLLTTTNLFVIIRLRGDNWQTLGYITHSTTTLGFKKYHYQWDRSHGDGGGDISYQICPRHISSSCGQLIIVGRSQVLSLSKCFPLSPITAAAQVRNTSDIVARHSCPAIPPGLTEMKHFLSRVILSC